MQSFPPLTTSIRDLLISGSDDWFRQAIYRINEAAARLQLCREAFGREMGLTGNQFLIIMAVAYMPREQEATIAAISSSAGLAPTHATTEVGRLQRLGLVEKRPHGTDRRSVVVSLTPEGRQAVRSIADTLVRVNDLLFADIGKDELTIAHRVAEKLVRNSERAQAELRIIESENQ